MPASPDTWRCFVAVPIPQTLRESLEDAVAAWRSDPSAPNLRWTDPAGWHITLAFLGATDPTAVPGLAERLAEVAARVEPFVVTTGAAGAFPRPGAAQSAWLGITDPGPGDRLAGLAEWVQAAVLPPDQRRRLWAHLTLGRSRARRGEPLGDWLAARTFPPMPIRVDELILHRSHLGRGPARYEVLARVPLGGAGSARG
jgi:2'-5' RNA ligase